MKKILLWIFIFFNFSLHGKTLSGTIENKNPKILDELFEKVRTKYNLNQYSNGLDKYASVDDITYVNTNRYTYTYKTFKAEPYKTVFLFRINIIYNKDDYSVKQLNLKRGTFGIIIINNLPKPTEKRKAFIYLGHEKELGMEVCLAPYSENDFKTITPTCKNKWDMYFYKLAGKRTLQHERKMLSDKLSKIDKELELKHFILDVFDATVDPYSKIAKGVLAKGISKSLSAIMPININNGKVNNDIGNIYANWIVTVIQGETIGLIDAGIEANHIIDTVLATFAVLDVEIARNNIEIAEKYLDLYYQYGSRIEVLKALLLSNRDKSKKLVYSQLNSNSNINEIVTQIAIDLGHYQEDKLSDSFGTGKFAGAVRRYDPNFSISIIKNIIERVIPPLSSKNLDSPSLQIYTKYKAK